MSSSPLLIRVPRVPRIDPQHLTRVIDTVHTPLVITITAHPRIILVKAKFSTRASIKATPPTNITRIVTHSRNLVPLQCLQSRVLRQKSSRKNKVARRLPIHAGHVGHNERLGDWLEMAGWRLLLLLLVL